MKFLSHKYKDLLEEIRRSNSQEKHIIAVTKYGEAQELKALIEAYEHGVRHFGENRVQSLVDKAQKLKELCNQEKIILDDFHWHFIGKLQSNKIKKLLGVPNLKAIHSIETTDQIKRIHSYEKLILGSQIDLFIQVNLSGEEQKSGVSSFDEVLEIALMIRGLKSKLHLRGLMCMGPQPGQYSREAFEEKTKICFKSARTLKEKLDEELSLSGGFDKIELSMGMSGDYHIALECGSSWLRMGSLLFEV